MELRSEAGAVLATARVSKAYPIQAFLCHFSELVEDRTDARLWIGDQPVSEMCHIVRSKPIRYLRRVERDDGKIGLTFDCAVGEAYTRDMLDILARYNARATFFMTGAFLRENGALVQEIVERGHEIGNHGKDHIHFPEESDDTVCRAIMELQTAFEQAGLSTRWVRAPYGENSRVSCAVAEAFDLVTVQWTADSLDAFEHVSSEEIYRAATQNLMSGDIYLFHVASQRTRDLLPRWIEHVQSNGYELVAMSELVLEGPSYIDENGVMRLKD